MTTKPPPIKRVLVTPEERLAQFIEEYREASEAACILAYTANQRRGPIPEGPDEDLYEALDRRQKCRERILTFYRNKP